MPRMPLINPANPKQDALALSELLTKLRSSLPEDDFDIVSFDYFDRLNADIENDRITPEGFFDNDTVKTAITALQKQNHTFFFELLRIVYNQPHTFSNYEKIFFNLSIAAVLAMSPILAHEFFTVFINGKPQLEATGEALQDYCTTGLAPYVINICSTLGDGMTAVFDMNRKTNASTFPASQGVVSDPIHGPVPGNVLHTIASLVDPIAWRDFFTCTQSNNTIQMVGHAYHGSLSSAVVKASDGFPVMLSNFSSLPDPLLGNVSEVLIAGFIALFCIKIQNGGYSIITDLFNIAYGHFDGFPRVAETFEKNEDIFASVSGVLTGVALLAFFVLNCIKMLSKWQASNEARQAFYDTRQVCALYKKYDQSAEVDDLRDSAHQRLEIA